MNNKKKITLMAVIYLIGFIPLITANIALTNFASIQLRKNMVDSTYMRLKACASSVNQYFTWDIREGILCRDDVSYEFIDSLKDSDIEQTFFEGDTCYISSITDETGARIEGTKADPDIWKIVSSGKDYKTYGVMIAGREYYVYYMPVKSDTGEVIGMAFAGEVAETIEKALLSVSLLMYGVSTILIVLFGIILFFVARLIRRPMSEAADKLNTLATGDLTVDPSVKSTMRETVTIISATQLLRDKLVDIITHVDNKVDILNTNTNTLTNQVTSVNTGTDQISTSVEELSNASTMLAENVQTVNNIAINMGDNITQIDTDVKSLTNVSQQMQTANAKAVDSMATVLDNSNQSSAIVDKIVTQVQSTNDAITKINDAVGLIMGITSQTNLLSLNASIEAARAGESGKGFAVVAGEIKALSEQSASSAATIQQIADDILSKSQESVTLAKDIQSLIAEEQNSISTSQEDFNALSKSIDESITIASSIATKTANLDEMKTEVIENISDLSAISQENAASTEEVNANVSSIAEAVQDIAYGTDEVKSVAIELSELMQYFSK